MNEYEFKAIMEKEIFYNDATCFGVFTFTTLENLPYVKPEYRLDTENLVSSGILSGSCQRLDGGQEYIVTARPVENKKYGWQYEIVNIRKDIPKGEDEIRNYLSSILVQSQVTTLLNVYPNIVQTIIDDNNFEPEYDLLPGIKEKTFSKIRQKILETYVISDILALLSPLGVTFTMIKNIAAQEKNVALLKQKLIDNPYQLIGVVKRMTFPKVDKFALNLNPSLLKSPVRVSAGITYLLNKVGEDEGHTVIPLATLRSRIKGLTPQAMEVFEKIVTDAKTNEENLIRVDTLKNNKGDTLEVVGLRMYYRMEKFILNKLKAVANNHEVANTYETITDKRIAEINEGLGFELSKEQESVLKQLVDKNVMFVSGKAGTGKTTIVKGILLANRDKRIAMCALSAKAARRITEVTNYPAKTIHKLLEYNGLQFTYDSKNLLECNILIVDESSMVNTSIFYALLQAVPYDCKVVIVGDHKQLPPIGAGAVFTDLLHTDDKEFVNVKLTHIYRQAQLSGIVMDANQIREGIVPFESVSPQIISGAKKDMLYIFRDDRTIIRNIILDIFFKYLAKGTSVEDIMVIVPRKEDVINCTREINNLILDRLIPEDGNTLVYGMNQFRTGCRVINVVNEYRKVATDGEEYPVLNGEIGTVLEVDITDLKNKKLIVNFGDEDKNFEFSHEELANLELGYCLTFHKTQGSQSKVVIIGIDMTHKILLSSNSIYTAITRASEECILVAQPSAFCYGVKNKLEQNRNTFISLKLINDEVK
jgi:exodeoxyribonuclease V alpha subunit